MRSNQEGYKNNQGRYKYWKEDNQERYSQLMLKNQVGLRENPLKELEDI